MKFEMEFGWIGNEKITVETFDFDKIQIIQEFIEFQEENGWAVNYEAVESDDFEDEEAEEDTEDEDVVLAGLDDNQ
jgi:hypothetical protein